jgi:anti-sigma B factor antagonist
VVQEPRAWSLRNLGGDDGARVVLTGEIDLDAAPEVTQELRAASQQFALPLLLDLGDVTLMDSVGLRVLLLAWQEANAAGSVITIVQASPPVRRMLEWTGTAPLFAIDLRPS